MSVPTILAVARRGVRDQRHQERAAEPGGHRARAEPQQQPRLHRAAAAVHDGAERFDDERGREIVRHRCQRRDAEQDQGGRQDGPAADAGEARQDADDERDAGERDALAHGAVTITAIPPLGCAPFVRGVL
jgi:hypothetical protein